MDSGPKFEALNDAVGELQQALRDTNALPPGFPMAEVSDLLGVLLLLPNGSPEDLPVKLQAAESFLSDLRRGYVPRDLFRDENADLPSFEHLRHAVSELMAELRGKLSELDPIVIAAATPTNEELTEFASATEQSDDLAKAIKGTRDADDAIRRGETLIEQNIYGTAVLPLIINFNDLKIGDALVRATAKLDKVRLHWLEKLGEGLAKAPDSILRLVRTFPALFGAVEVIAKELKAATNRIVAHLEQFVEDARDSSRSGIRPDAPETDVINTTDQNSALPLRVLIAEPNTMDRRVLADRFELLGYHLDIVADGVAAVDAVSRAPYDVVLMEVRLLVMNGLDAARKIRELPGSAGRIPIITISTMNVSEEERIQTGINECFQKPFNFAELLQVIAKLTHRELSELSSPPIVKKKPWKRKG